jgi:hypothetical protein
LSARTPVRKKDSSGIITSRSGVVSDNPAWLTDRERAMRFPAPGCSPRLGLVVTRGRLASASAEEMTT